MDREDLLALVILVGGFILLVWVVLGLARGLDRRACINFEKFSGRETEFVIYTGFSWDCLTPTADGKMISAGALREITD